MNLCALWNFLFCFSETFCLLSSPSCSQRLGFRSSWRVLVLSGFHSFERKILLSWSRKGVYANQHNCTQQFLSFPNKNAQILDHNEAQQFKSNQEVPLNSSHPVFFDEWTISWPEHKHMVPVSQQQQTAVFPKRSDFLTVEQQQTGGMRKKEGRSKPREDGTQAGCTSLTPECLTETERRGRGESEDWNRAVKCAFASIFDKWCIYFPHHMI